MLAPVPPRSCERLSPVLACGAFAVFPPAHRIPVRNGDLPLHSSVDRGQRWCLGGPLPSVPDARRRRWAAVYAPPAATAGGERVICPRQEIPARRLSIVAICLYLCAWGAAPSGVLEREPWGGEPGICVRELGRKSARPFLPKHATRVRTDAISDESLPWRPGAGICWGKLTLSSSGPHGLRTLVVALCRETTLSVAGEPGEASSFEPQRPSAVGAWHHPMRGIDGRPTIAISTPRS